MSGRDVRTVRRIQTDYLRPSVFLQSHLFLSQLVLASIYPAPAQAKCSSGPNPSTLRQAAILSAFHTEGSSIYRW